MYSFSKSFLNLAIRLLQINCPKNIRIIAVCPGNFISPITSSNDDFEDVISADVAAQDILQIAFDWNRFNGKHFYRNCKIISW